MRPLPVPDTESAPYWAAARENRFQLPRCQECRSILFPPRPRCPRCQSPRLEWEDLSGGGTIFSFCIVHEQLVHGFSPPYAVAEVELDDQPGLVVTTNILGASQEALRIGAPVRVTFEDTGETVLPQFELMS